MSAPSNHTELSAFASELLSMLRDKPNDWKESLVLGGEDSIMDELIRLPSILRPYCESIRKKYLN